MAETPWTPGPLKIVPNPFGSHLIQAADGSDVADVHRYDDAVLFIAAPDLYEALEYAYPFVKYCQHEHMGDIEGDESDKTTAREKILAAMLKANPKQEPTTT